MIKNPYLILLQKNGIEPNFFCSDAYLSQPGMEVKQSRGWMWIEQDGVAIFPALPQHSFAGIDNYPIKESWSDFNNYKPGIWGGLKIEKEFLDLEYIYNPTKFLDLSGGDWEVFRKNSRKWAKQQNNSYVYNEYRNEDKVRNLLVNWLEKRQDDAEDAEAIVWFILESGAKSVYVKYLYDANGELAAINCADYNHMYINYRYLICRDEPYLDEFARLLFYTDPVIQASQMFVNDGGVLGNPGLQRFKDRLNPVQIRKVYSWKN